MADIIPEINHKNMAKVFRVRQFARDDAKDETISRLSEEAVRDSLTGLYNRGFLDKRVSDLTSRGVKYGAMLFDIDHFKRVNDENGGHPAGDAVLREFSRLLIDNIRPTDGAIAARYGGEEFMLLIPDLVNVESLRQRAETIRKMISETRFRIPDGSLNITTSVGVGVWDGQQNKDDFMKGIDDALYRAKQAGRNRVEVA